MKSCMEWFKDLSDLLSLVPRTVCSLKCTVPNRNSIKDENSMKMKFECEKTEQNGEEKHKISA